MSSHPPQSCCLEGVIHEGESVGEYKELGGIKTYLSYPPDKSTDHAILYICDAFGLEFVNNRLLADSFARQGYLVITPDIFSGDPAPTNAFSSPPGNFNLRAWIGKHSPAQVDPIVETAIRTARDELGVKKLGAVGYCFGGRYVVRFLREGGGLDAGFVAHPSGVTAGEMEAVQGPLSVAAAEIDQIMPLEKRHETEEILRKSGLPYEVTLYGGVEHGFGVRTDLSVRRKRVAMEGAFRQAVRWFDEWLKG